MLLMITSASGLLYLFLSLSVITNQSSPHPKWIWKSNDGGRDTAKATLSSSRGGSLLHARKKASLQTEKHNREQPEESFDTIIESQDQSHNWRHVFSVRPHAVRGWENYTSEISQESRIYEEKEIPSTNFKERYEKAETKVKGFRHENQIQVSMNPRNQKAQKQKLNGKAEIRQNSLGPTRINQNFQKLSKDSDNSQWQPEIRQVVFAKVHKAASSTVQNILLRFAMARNLSVLLPQAPKTSIFSERTSKINPELVIHHPAGFRFDIFCSHVIYDDSVIAKYFPQSAVRVAILREPLKQALSALAYYSTRYPTRALSAGLRRYPHDPINGFLLHPNHFESPDDYWGPARSYTNNRMSIDLGFDLKNFEMSKKNKTKIQAFLNRLDKVFNIVLISDYFDESMVLLKRYLHWQIKDILHIRVNTANQKVPVWNKKPVLNSTAIHTFRQWNAIDYQLYEHFLPQFFRRIKSEPRFEDEVTFFKEIQERVKTFCDDKLTKTLKIPENIWSNEFTVFKLDCKLMATPEVALAQIVREKQLKRYETEFEKESLEKDK